ncbi:MAG TPA: adenylate cyclase regulatory domain-containing protein [Acidimicrobiia bacterium]|nr:adenylate cyclase regulatory domain-containing protein [Acidimicrobiia bacterium]
MDANEREWLERGLYDPRAANAADRVATLRYLAARGATTDDLAAAAATDTLPILAGELLERRVPRLSRREAAERAGISVELAERISRTAGLGVVGPDEAVLFESDVTTFRLFAAAAEMFGTESTLQFVRVAGAALASIADAAMTNFGQGVAPRLDAEQAGELARAQAAEAASLILFDEVPAVLINLFLHHCETATRRAQTAGNLDTSDLTVGFLDLVGSTVLAERLSPAELGALISAFEREATEVVSATDGRVVKTIGDEVMFVTTDAVAACTIALDLADGVERHAVLHRLTGGLAAGPLVRGYGLYYGPILSTAARAAKLAEPGSVLVTDVVRARATSGGVSFRPIGEHVLRGFDTAVALFELERA